MSFLTPVSTVTPPQFSNDQDQASSFRSALDSQNAAALSKAHSVESLFSSSQSLDIDANSRPKEQRGQMEQAEQGGQIEQGGTDSCEMEVKSVLNASHGVAQIARRIYDALPGKIEGSNAALDHGIDLLNQAIKSLKDCRDANPGMSEYERREVDHAIWQGEHIRDNSRAFSRSVALYNVGSAGLSAVLGFGAAIVGAGAGLLGIDGAPSFSH